MTIEMPDEGMLKRLGDARLEVLCRDIMHEMQCRPYMRQVLKEMCGDFLYEIRLEETPPSVRQKFLIPDLI